MVGQLAARWVPNLELERQAQQIIARGWTEIAPRHRAAYTDW